MSHLGKSIKLFLADGSPQGIITAEIMNWTGHVIIGPRTQLTEIVQRKELQKTGIYFLTGPDPESEKDTLYIGESDVVSKRLVQHNKDESKDFWDKVCIVTSKDQNLTKAHAKYLESRLISLSNEGGIVSVHNGTAPLYEYLPEADIADMEYFIGMIRLILPTLGYDFLREKPKVSGRKFLETSLSNVPLKESPIFILTSPKHGLSATAQEVGPDFVVLSGSEAQSNWIGSSHHSYSKLFEKMISEEKLILQTDVRKRIFKEDTAFNSPSAAATVIFGRASNGRTAWKVSGTSKTYEDWQNDQLSQIM